MMKITAISDLHGYKPKLSGGDLLIIAGDCTGRDSNIEWKEFYDWLRLQKYDLKILIGGNHDNFLENIKNSDQAKLMGENDDSHQYLCNNGMDFRGYKIWGCPVTHRFAYQNPCAMAFSSWKEDELYLAYHMIPDDTEILITHTPQYGVLDYAPRQQRCGSPLLSAEMKRLKNLKLHLFGHIHNGYGMQETDHYISYNCSHVDEFYQNVNEPHIIELPEKCNDQEDMLPI